MKLTVKQVEEKQDDGWPEKLPCLLRSTKTGNIYYAYDFLDRDRNKICVIRLLATGENAMLSGSKIIIERYPNRVEPFYGKVILEQKA